MQINPHLRKAPKRWRACKRPECKFKNLTQQIKTLNLLYENKILSQIIPRRFLKNTNFERRNLQEVFHILKSMISATAI